MVEITPILKEAFKKLLTATYYDKTDMVMRYNVATLAKEISSEDKNKEDEFFNNLVKVVKGENKDLLDEWLNKMTLSFYPKKVTSQKDKKDDHVITDISPKNVKVERLMVKANIPVELCILDVAWLLLYGYKVDDKGSEHSYGNRLEIKKDHSGVRSGNALFKKYQNQYKNWWESGIKVANEHLEKKENVTIINFDIRNCYHSIVFNFNEFFEYCKDKNIEQEIENDKLTKIIQRIYEKYWELVQNAHVNVFKKLKEKKGPLPLTLMSAHVLANWYLSPLDEYITSIYKPYYYGRYVDDCMLVVKTTTSPQDTRKDIFEKELPGLFNNYNTKFAFEDRKDYKEYKRLNSFYLQKEKTYVYKFNYLLPQSSLEKFKQEQMERSSEFRFLTDDFDTSNRNLESVTLVNTLDSLEEEPGRRFNILEENKYKLAVYLAKLSSDLSKYIGNENKDKVDKLKKEVDKVYNFFTEGYLIKHYQLWERLMTVFVLADQEDYVNGFIDKVTDQINQIKENELITEGLFTEPETGKKQLIKSLIFHLKQSQIMALSLHGKNSLSKSLHGKKSLSKNETLYLDTFMVRMHYNQLPLQEFSDKFKKEGVKLTADINYVKKLFGYQWMPYYVQYHEIVSALSIGEKFDPQIYEKAFRIYITLNRIDEEKHKDDWMVFCQLPKDGVTEFNVDLEVEPSYKNKRTVAVVEMDIDNKDALKIIDNYGKVDPNKIAVFDNILDQITKIYNTDIFILPELSLPIYELKNYCRYAAKNERAFVSGIEYVVKNDYVYNYIITCLPITLYGNKDAVPVIRLKNHYAPKEIEGIEGKNKKIPKDDKIWQNLYHWHGHMFTSYYCYELTNIKERSFFFSMIDAMYCPVFNSDTYYFNNIAESMARDMHCYFILCNVSHYGDSRVTQPTSHVMMNLLKVKGGNTEDNKAVVLSATLDVEGLRAFQQKKLIEQKEDKNFKTTPPDYDKKFKKVISRFKYPCEKGKSASEDFMMKLIENLMMY